MLIMPVLELLLGGPAPWFPASPPAWLRPAGPLILTLLSVHGSMGRRYMPKEIHVQAALALPHGLRCCAC